MKKILAGVAGVLAVAVLAVLALAAQKPDTFHLERTASIQAPPEKVRALIDNFHQWTRWSPWEGKDPGMARTYAGPESGKGAVYGWKGNKDVGEGRMEVLSDSPTEVKINLEFLAPFPAKNVATFTLKPEGKDATTVVWAMDGPLNFGMKVFHVFMDMDKLVGKDFELGLHKLGAAATAK